MPRNSGSVATVAPSQVALRASSSDFPRRILTVAWMSILLGFAIEALLLAVATGMSGGLERPAPFVADLVQKVSWSVLVCLGLGVGTSVVKARPAVMGGLGFVAAPVAFSIAKALHKGMGAALGVAGVVGGPSTLLMALLKAVEYGVFGVALGRISQKSAAGLGIYTGVGLVIGVVFGGAITALIAQAGATGSNLATRAMNEMIFPLGCALVLYVADALGRKTAS